MTDTTQPGTEVDAELWRRFREEVEARHGVVRGNLKDALETAIEAYLDGEDMNPTEVNRRLARIEAAVGVEVADGGTDTSEPAADTHTRDRVLDVPEERPHPRGDTRSKVRWLAAEVVDAEAESLADLKMTHENTVRDVIEAEYNFTEDKTEEYVPKVIDELGLVDHPSADVLYVTETEREELIEKQREKARADARERTEKLEADE